MEQPIDWKTVHPSVIRLLKKPQMEQRTEPWYAARRRMTITGSEAASVLEGTPWKNPYKSRNQLFREKTGQRERDQSNFATQHGTYYEDEALQKYVQQTGQRPLLFGLIEHPNIDWIGGSPDAITLEGRLVEIKVRTLLFPARHNTEQAACQRCNACNDDGPKGNLLEIR